MQYFIPGVYFQSYETVNKRHTISEEVVQENAIYYNVSCFNIESLLNGSTKQLNLEDAFTKRHPSILSHAHMAVLLILYYTEVILDAIDRYLETGIINGNEVNANMPEPKYINNADYDSVCWSAITFNFNTHNLKHSLFALPSNSTNGFTQVIRGWESEEETRFDLRGGYMTSKMGQHLYITFNISKKQEKKKEDRMYEVSLALSTSKSKFTVELIHKHFPSHQVNLTYSGTENNLKVTKITQLPPGEWTLHVVTLEGSIIINGIIIC